MKTVVAIILMAVGIVFTSCQKNIENTEPSKTFVYLVAGEEGSSEPENTFQLGEFSGEGPHRVTITDQQWELVKNYQEIYISWNKFTEDEKIYIDDGFIDVEGKDHPIYIP